MRTITVYDIDHAIEILFYDNLETKFEDEFGVWREEERFYDYLERVNVTLEMIVDFLNRHRDVPNESYVIWEDN